MIIFKYLTDFFFIEYALSSISSASFAKIFDIYSILFYRRETVKMMNGYVSCATCLMQN